MIEDLNTVYKGSATLIKNRQYLSTKAYLEPFVERLSKLNAHFTINVKVADQMSVNNNTVNTLYNRILATAVLPTEFKVEKKTFHRVVCMAYSLDTKTPIAKFYTGVIDELGDFYAFGGDCIQMQKIEPDMPLDYGCIDEIIKAGEKDQCQKMLEQISKVDFDKSDILTKVGEWVDFTIKKEYINDSGKIKLSTTLPIDIYKDIHLDMDSDFFSKENPKLLSVCNAFMDRISADDKDITNRYEKTQLVNQLLKL